MTLASPLSHISRKVAHIGRRRNLTDWAMTGVLTATMVATIAVLVWVLGYVAAEGLQYLGPQFLTQTPPGNPAQPGGGFLNGIIGSLIIVGIATALSIPIGIAAAIYFVEYGGRLARYARFVTDVMVGIPTIVTGAFIYAIWVVHFGFSGIAGGIALALIMLPLITRRSKKCCAWYPTTYAKHPLHSE